MRYKANFRPQYILGMFHSCLCLSTSFCTTWKSCTASDPFLCCPDPESGDWDPLAGELTEKLNSRSYVSLSRDRRSSPEPVVPEIDGDEEEVSLFDMGMPGILTASQVEALDLGHWLLSFDNGFVHMNVSILFLFFFWAALSERNVFTNSN